MQMRKVYLVGHEQAGYSVIRSKEYPLGTQAFTRCQGPFKSEKAALEALGGKQICGECGYFVDLCRVDREYTHLCWFCSYWMKRVYDFGMAAVFDGVKRNPDSRIVVDHSVYTVGKEPRSREDFRDAGFGGREFHVRNLNSGKEFISHNMWRGGTVPERFKTRIANTHEFLNGRRVKAGNKPGLRGENLACSWK